jgi:hypothetical protein
MLISWSRQKRIRFAVSTRKAGKERLTEAKAVSQPSYGVNAYDNKRNVGAGSLVDPNRI